ncbi:hypothetical protein NEOCIP111885_03988 [Pseudoneobacillus rhizosphaerae]|uniref:Uncharacterized protein n=1 Tax=Pseudoneobacillus rhizosphaerae TaxID=2880968 RepID=A0A9C7LCF6_9BACI|nr:hypothetical protein NEOCIP111885_03988 [Pseudoneobacillus rhizosphaerae]
MFRRLLERDFFDGLINYLYYEKVNSLQQKTQGVFLLEKNHTLNLLYLTPSTVPMFLLGYINKSVTLMTAGIILLAIYIIIGLKQIRSKI